MARKLKVVAAGYPGDAAEAGHTKPPEGRRNRTNHFELAYDRIEHLIVTCALKPGQVLALQDLQGLAGLGRTPVHQAVTRFAADTLIVIRDRSRIFPPDG